LSAIISVRVPKELKEKMNKFKNRIKWSKEIREFIEKKIIELMRESVVESANRYIEKLPEIPKGTAVRYVREDRDSR